MIEKLFPHILRNDVSPTTEKINEIIGCVNELVQRLDELHKMHQGLDHLDKHHYRSSDDFGKIVSEFCKSVKDNPYVREVQCGVPNKSPKLAKVEMMRAIMDDLEEDIRRGSV